MASPCPWKAFVFCFWGIVLTVGFDGLVGDSRGLSEGFGVLLAMLMREMLTRWWLLYRKYGKVKRNKLTERGPSACWLEKKRCDLAACDKVSPPTRDGFNLPPAGHKCS